MKRKLLLGAFAIAIVCVGAVGASYYPATSEENDLDITNVEALSRGDANVTFYCEGNTSICAKGHDENTNKDFVIHGVLKQ